MPIDQTKLAKGLIHILNTCGDWIEFESLCQAVLPEIGQKRVTENLRDEISEMLVDEAFESVVLARPTAEDNAEDEYIARWHFFEGARFLASLTPFELEHQVLVPGHRFFPFIKPGWPGDAVLRYKGKTLKTKVVKMPFADTAVYHTLVGRMGWSVYLSQDNSQKEVERAAETGGPVNITVFDLAPIFKDVKDPQRLVLQCRNFTELEIDIVDVPEGTPPVDFQAVQQGVAELDRALTDIFEEYGPDGLILPEQIALAYARMPEWFFTDPPFHFGGYLKLSDKVRLAEGSLDTILWHADQDPDEDSDFDFEAALQAVESLAEERGIKVEALLQEIAENGLDNMEEMFDDMTLSGPTPAVQRSLASRTQSDLDLEYKTYRLKVVIEGDKKTYRIIDVHSANTWHELHREIFDAFDRYDEHLYSFFFPPEPTKSERTRIQSLEIGCPEVPGGPDDAQCVKVGEIPLKKGGTFYYLFDWGDCWWHEIKVQSVTETDADDEFDLPAIIERMGESPEQY